MTRALAGNSLELGDAGGGLILIAIGFKIIGGTKAGRRRRARRIARPTRARMAFDFGRFRSKQTANNKSPHFAAAKRGDNAAL
jgi:hypothetical protein